MKEGIKHIEFWVSDLKRSDRFYSEFFNILGWKKVGDSSFKLGSTKLYFKQSDKSRIDTLGVRHICFWAKSRVVVDKVAELVKAQGVKKIRGSVEMKGKEYSSGYYTVDFCDPDGCIVEVAHTPD